MTSRSGSDAAQAHKTYATIMSAAPQATRRESEAQEPTGNELFGNARSLPSTTAAAASVTGRSVLSASNNMTLPNDYAELVTLMSQFDAELATMKDRMQRLTESVPTQARLTTLWEEQARDWETANGDDPTGGTRVQRKKHPNRKHK
jgi:hypothetical protein